MRHHHNEPSKAQPELFLITLETEHELKVPVDSVIRVALSSLGTVKEIKVIEPETAELPKLFLITLETDHELKVPVDSVIRVGLSFLGTVKEIKVIEPEMSDSPAGGAKEISLQP